MAERDTNPHKKRGALFWVMTSVVIALLLLSVLVYINLPKPQYVSDTSFDLAVLSDGIYQGECDNGLVYVNVEVEVKDHTIADVRILEHRNGLGRPAEAVIDDVTGSQSVEVDAVSGATLSSQTILKAIENALYQSQLEI